MITVDTSLSANPQRCFYLKAPRSARSSTPCNVISAGKQVVHVSLGFLIEVESTKHIGQVNINHTQSNVNFILISTLELINQHPHSKKCLAILLWVGSAL